MPRGSRPGERRGGRKAGVPNQRTRAAKALRDKAASSGTTPLDYMLGLMRDSKAELAVRTDMAKAAAPYMHPRLAAVEHTGKDGGPIETKETGDALGIARRIAFALAQGVAAADKGESA